MQSSNRVLRGVKPLSRYGWLVFLVVISLLSNVLSAAGAVYAVGSPSYWQKGVSYYPYHGTGDWQTANSDASLANARQTNANYITFIMLLEQTYLDSTTITRTSYGPSDDDLRHGIAKAHQLGMKAAIKPHLDPTTGGWRAYIKPKNDADRDTWFANYSAWLYHFVDIAKETGAEEVVIGAELVSVATYTENPDNTQRWVAMIDHIRNVQHYTGYLTYSANWGASGFALEFPNIGFWDKLDFIGISAYFEIGTYATNNPTVADFENKWNTYRTQSIEPVQRQYNKPVLFTEVGYRSYQGATRQPWFNGTVTKTYSPQEQSDAIQALVDYWDRYDYFSGVQYWWWDTNPACCGAGDKDYFVQNKTPSQSTMQNWYADYGSPGAALFTITNSTVSPAREAPGTTFGLTATVQSSQSITANVVALVTDPNNNTFPVGSQTYAFTAGNSHSFSFNWASPPTATLGTYVFSLKETRPSDNAVYQNAVNVGTFTDDCTIVVFTADTPGQCGSLSRAISTANNAASSKHTVTFSLPDPTQPVHMSGTTAVNLPTGTTIQGDCTVGQPHVAIVGQGQPGMVLNGGNLNGVTISGFAGPQLTTNAHDSRLSCVKVLGNGAAGIAPPAFSVAPQAQPRQTNQAQAQRTELLATTLPMTVLKVERPTVFQGMTRYPTQAQPGQELVAVTVDFQRDPLNHLLSSQSGDVYLTDETGTKLYYTVDTNVAPDAGAGLKPGQVTTFVFAVPSGAKGLTFHYGPKYLRQLS